METINEIAQRIKSFTQYDWYNMFMAIGMQLEPDDFKAMCKEAKDGISDAYNMLRMSKEYKGIEVKEK